VRELLLELPLGRFTRDVDERNAGEPPALDPLERPLDAPLVEDTDPGAAEEADDKEEALEEELNEALEDPLLLLPPPLEETDPPELLLLLPEDRLLPSRP